MYLFVIDSLYMLWSFRLVSRLISWLLNLSY